MARRAWPAFASTNIGIRCDLQGNFFEASTGTFSAHGHWRRALEATRTACGRRCAQDFCRCRQGRAARERAKARNAQRSRPAEEHRLAPGFFTPGGMEMPSSRFRPWLQPRRVPPDRVSVFDGRRSTVVMPRRCRARRQSEERFGEATNFMYSVGRPPSRARRTRPAGSERSRGETRGAAGFWSCPTGGRSRSSLRL